MSTLSHAQVQQLARQAGLTANAAKIASAIAAAESGLNPAAVGDTTITTQKWGPSVGLWQIRSLKAQEGTGKERDASRLADPAFNAASMAKISGKGSDWTPWSAYTSGAYKDHLDAAGSTDAAGSVAHDWNTGAPGASTAKSSPSSLFGTIEHVASNNPVTEAIDDAMENLVRGVQRSMLMFSVIGLGAALIGVGAWRAVNRG